MAKTKTRRKSDHEPKTEPDREPKTEPLLMNEKAAARLLGFKVRTLQTWRHRGGGPPFIRVSPRCIRYRKEDLLAWIEERRRLSTSDAGPGEGSPERKRDRPPSGG